MTASSDVTERTCANDEVKAANAVLEKRVQECTAELLVANKELEAFSYSVSHDLRAPLRSINGFSRILLEDYGKTLDPGALDCVRTIRSATQNLSQLIDDLLAFSRTTRTELRRTDVDMSALAADVVDELRKQHPAQVVSVAIEPGLAVVADPNLLRIVLLNLLSNAWKFSSKRQESRIEFGRALTKTGPAFVVRDNGAGFDSHYATKLFRPFQRLHTQDEFPGRGIGLATVQRIIHRHGGHLWAESMPDQGASFYFTLP